MIFKVSDVLQLIKCDAGIVSGLYLMANRTHHAAVEKLGEEKFKATGSFDFITPETVAKKTGPFEVGYAGFGFTLVKQGVFEKLEYPWFRPTFMQIGECFEFTSEDVGFCMQARDVGIKFLVHPKVIVGQRKIRGAASRGLVNHEARPPEGRSDALTKISRCSILS